MHHGAGSSGLSFAACADEIRKILPNAGILSLDARGHGRTTTAPVANSPDHETPSLAAAAQLEAEGQVQLDLTLETLSKDLVYVISKTQERMGWEKQPDIVLVGHSLGGAVITDVAKNGELGPKLLAYAVLDVVEGEHYYTYLYRVLLSDLYLLSRIRHGCASKHGKVPFNSTNQIPLLRIWNRMAVSTVAPLLPSNSVLSAFLQYSLPHNSQHWLSQSFCSLLDIRRAIPC